MSDTYGADSIPPVLPNTQQAPAPDLAGQWRSWINDPGNKAALIQTGLALAQPVALGQNALGHVAGAIGQGGEASDRVTAQEEKDREQTRKEADTESRSLARESSANSAESRANAATIRAQSEAAQVDSRIQLRKSQALAAESRASQADANVKMLEMRIALYPDDAQARIDLARARTAKAQADTELSIERAGVVEQDSATRAKRADTQATDVGSKVETRAGTLGVQQQNADTRRDQGAARIGIGQEKNRLTEQGQGLGASVKTRRNYDQYVNETNKANSDAKLMDPKASPQPVLSFDDWKARAGTGGGTAIPPPPSPSSTPDARPSPGAGGATTPRFYKVNPADVTRYPDAQKAPDGNYYIQR